MPPLCFFLIILFTIEFLVNFIWNQRKRSHEREVLIEKLPDHLLSSIISFLPAEEAVRTSVVAKQWKSLWSYTQHLDFNQNHMLESAFQQWFQIYNNRGTSEEEVYDAYDNLMFQFVHVIRSIRNMLVHHYGVLRSCRIVHITDSCRNGDIVGFIRYLVEEKKVQELDLECQFIESWDSVYLYKNFKGDASTATIIKIIVPPTLDLCFRVLASCVVLKLTNYVLKNSSPLPVCQNLKTLKLNKVWISEELFEAILLNCVSLEQLSLIGCKHFKRLRIHSPHIKFLELREMTLVRIEVFAANLEVMVLDTLVCQWRGLVIDAPNVRVFRAYYSDPKARGMSKLHFQRVLLTTRVILTTFTNLLTSKGSVGTNMLANLVTLSIDLDLNGGRDILALCLALRSCISLENLVINIKDYNISQNSSSYIDSKFWERTEPCIGICQKLKTVYLKGFRGKEREVEFAKYLIARATVMERITIICNTSIQVAEKLLSIRRASGTLFINLKFNSVYG